MITLSFLALWFSQPVWVQDGPCWSPCYHEHANPSFLDCKAVCIRDPSKARRQ